VAQGLGNEQSYLNVLAESGVTGVNMSAIRKSNNSFQNTLTQSQFQKDFSLMDADQQLSLIQDAIRQPSEKLS
jgi:hypothetical protein